MRSAVVNLLLFGAALFICLYALSRVARAEEPPEPEPVRDGFAHQLHALTEKALVEVWGVRGLVVSVQMADLPGSTAGQSGYQHFKTCAWTADILAPTWPDFVLWATVVHESGHCIGLPHNLDRASVMYWQLTYPPGVPLASDYQYAFQIRQAVFYGDYYVPIPGIARQ